MIIKKVFICIVCCFFIFSGCKKNQIYGVTDSDDAMEEWLIERARAQAKADVENRAQEAEKDQAKRMAAELIAKETEKKNKFSVLYSSNLNEIVNNFNFSFSFDDVFSIYNNKGNWECDFPGGDDKSVFISYEVIDDALNVFVSVGGEDVGAGSQDENLAVKKNDGDAGVVDVPGVDIVSEKDSNVDSAAENRGDEKKSDEAADSAADELSVDVPDRNVDFSKTYKFTITRNELINYISANGSKLPVLEECYDYDINKALLADSQSKDNEKVFITTAHVSNSEESKKTIWDKEFETVISNTIWVTSLKGDRKFRQFETGVIGLPRECKYLIFEKHNKDIFVFYGYSDFPGESPVYDHFAGKMNGIRYLDESHENYEIYITPITNISQLIDDGFVNDVATAVYGEESFVITVKIVEEELEDDKESKKIVENEKYIVFDENFNTSENKFLKYNKNNPAGSYYNARVRKDEVLVMSSMLVCDPILEVLNKDDYVRLLSKSSGIYSDFDKDGNWCTCELKDGRHGWIFGGALECADIDDLPIEKYVIHDTNKNKEDAEVDYDTLLGRLYYLCEEEYLGYQPVRYSANKFTVTDNKFLSKICDGKVYIGIDKSELIKLIGEPVKKINDFTFVYCDEYMIFKYIRNHRIVGTFTFNKDNKLQSLQIAGVFTNEIPE